eukprot:scaffold2119_cov355-Prasinococcus_capsulatus_cf.AAC.2
MPWPCWTHFAPRKRRRGGVRHRVIECIARCAPDYISSKSELEYVKAERSREAWENENYPEGEQEEMVQLYRKRGLSEEDATQVPVARDAHRHVPRPLLRRVGVRADPAGAVRGVCGDAEQVIAILSKYPDVFLDTMMVEELGLMPPDEGSGRTLLRSRRNVGSPPWAECAALLPGRRRAVEERHSDLRLLLRVRHRAAADLRLLPRGGQQGVLHLHRPLRRDHVHPGALACPPRAVLALADRALTPGCLLRRARAWPRRSSPGRTSCGRASGCW